VRIDCQDGVLTIVRYGSMSFDEVSNVTHPILPITEDLLEGMGDAEDPDYDPDELAFEDDEQGFSDAGKLLLHMSQRSWIESLELGKDTDHSVIWNAMTQSLSTLGASH
jgi:hypothetical protein